MPESPEARPIGWRERFATRATFFLTGLGMAAWAPLVPYVKSRLELDSADLGLLLLCLAAGAIVPMPLAGILTARFGCRRVILLASLSQMIFLPFLAMAPSVPAAIPGLLGFGAAVGMLDCVMNIQALIVERADGRTLMPGFHGLFSAGGIAGAGGVSGLLALGLSPFQASLCTVALIGIVSTLAGRHLLGYGSPLSGRVFRLPRGIVLVIAGLCFIMFVTEGSALDWSAVFLTTRAIDPALAGMGYAAFAVFMTLGRLLGDAVVRRAGPRRVVVVGGLIAATGLAVAVLVDSWKFGIAGYALLGAGCSSIVPVLYGALGRQTVMPEAAAVPAVTTIAYGGMLLGPVAIGFFAHAFGLSAALMTVAFGLVVVAAGGTTLSE